MGGLYLFFFFAIYPPNMTVQAPNHWSTRLNFLLNFFLKNSICFFVQVKIFKNPSGKTEVWVQSELRVGRSDLDVNLKRMQALLGYLGMTLS